MILTALRLTLGKDLRRTWPLLALLYAALAAWVVLLHEAPWEAGSNESERAILHFWWIATLGALWHFVGMLAAGRAVLDDPPAGGEPFWATRPLSRDGLLLAKLVFLAGALWLPMTLSRSIVASFSGLESWMRLQGSWGAGLPGDLVVLGFAALLAGFAASLRAWVRLAVGFFVVAYVAWSAVSGLYFRWLSATGPGQLRPAGALILLALSVSILWWQYRRLGLPAWVESPILRLRRPGGRRRERTGPDRPRPKRARRLFSETLHHLGKDLARLWPVVVALVLLLAYRLNELMPAEVLAAEPVLEGSWTAFHRTWLKFLVLLAVGLAVFEDPPLGRDPFWATRPIRPARLAAVKAVFAFGCVLMPVLGAEAVALVAYGLDLGRLPAALGEAALSMAETMAAAVAVSVLVHRTVAWLVVLITMPILHEIATGVPVLVLGLFLEPQYGSLTAWILAQMLSARRPRGLVGLDDAPALGLQRVLVRERLAAGTIDRDRHPGQPLVVGVSGLVPHRAAGRRHREVRRPLVAAAGPPARRAGAAGVDLDVGQAAGLAGLDRAARLEQRIGERHPAGAGVGGQVVAERHRVALDLPA